MHDNVFQELKPTIHYTNRSGVRATCPDCHVPHRWTAKIARKMQASKEVWGKIFGTINTREKFLAHRHELAEREWARLGANDSLECRNCHSAESMDITRQSQRAVEAHERFLFTGERTCIDCHKGIAHRLPDMAPTAQRPRPLRLRRGRTLPRRAAVMRQFSRTTFPGFRMFSGSSARLIVRISTTPSPCSSSR